MFNLFNDLNNPDKLLYDHEFCRECIDEWLYKKLNDSCSQCRTKLYEVGDNGRKIKKISRIFYKDIHI